MSHVGRRAGTLRPPGRGRQATSKALIVLAIVATGLIAAPIGLSYYLAKASGKDRPPIDLASLHMVNYYPSGGGWKYQWTRFDPAGIDADLTRARSIGANTIRIFLLPGAMGYPKPQPVMLARLEQLLTIAARHHLRVGISLFDGFHRYGDRDGSAAWAKAVLEPHSHDSRIAFVEVQNEIDPDNPAAMDWLRATLPVVRSLAPGVPDTVSAPGAGGAARLARLKGALGSTLPDFFDFHYFGGPEWAASTFAAARQAAGLGAAPNRRDRLLDGSGQPSRARRRRQRRGAGGLAGPLPAQRRVRCALPRPATGGPLDADGLRARRDPPVDASLAAPRAVPLRPLPCRRPAEARRGRRASRVHQGADRDLLSRRVRAAA